MKCYLGSERDGENFCHVLNTPCASPSGIGARVTPGNRYATFEARFIARLMMVVEKKSSFLMLRNSFECRVTDTRIRGT